MTNDEDSWEVLEQRRLELHKQLDDALVRKEHKLAAELMLEALKISTRQSELRFGGRGGRFAVPLYSPESVRALHQRVEMLEERMRAVEDQLRKDDEVA